MSKFKLFTSLMGRLLKGTIESSSAVQVVPIKFERPEDRPRPYVKTAWAKVPAGPVILPSLTYADQSRVIESKIAFYEGQRERLWLSLIEQHHPHQIGDYRKDNEGKLFQVEKRDFIAGANGISWISWISKGYIRTKDRKGNAAFRLVSHLSRIAVPLTLEVKID